jgi:hypothetical protein
MEEVLGIQIRPDEKFVAEENAEEKNLGQFSMN